jgi:hypothetical protein
VFFIVLSCLLLLFFILQIRWISPGIISLVNSRVLPLFMFVGSCVIILQTHLLKLAVPFRETLMHSCGVILYKIVYITELKCTILTIFYNEFEVCHDIE